MDAKHDWHADMRALFAELGKLRRLTNETGEDHVVGPEAAEGHEATRKRLKLELLRILEKGKQRLFASANII